VAVITCWQVARWPQASVATHVRVIVLGAGHGPPLWLSAKVTVRLGSQLSVARAVPVAPGAVEALQPIVRLAGQLMVGAVLSRTVIVWAQVLVLPQRSAAIQVRLMTLVVGQLPAASVSV
jgi:hypothetical protein